MSARMTATEVLKRYTRLERLARRAYARAARWSSRRSDYKRANRYGEKADRYFSALLYLRWREDRVAMSALRRLYG